MRGLEFRADDAPVNDGQKLLREFGQRKHHLLVGDWASLPTCSVLVVGGTEELREHRSHGRGEVRNSCQYTLGMWLGAYGGPRTMSAAIGLQQCAHSIRAHLRGGHLRLRVLRCVSVAAYIKVRLPRFKQVMSGLSDAEAS